MFSKSILGHRAALESFEFRHCHHADPRGERVGPWAALGPGLPGAKKPQNLGWNGHKKRAIDMEISRDSWWNISLQRAYSVDIFAVITVKRATTLFLKPCPETLSFLKFNFSQGSWEPTNEERDLNIHFKQDIWMLIKKCGCVYQQLA